MNKPANTVISEAHTIKVLCVEDNPGDARLIREMLAADSKDNFRVTVAKNLATGQQSLARGGYEVVLLDLGLPDSSGHDSLLTLHAEAPQIPMVVLTGLNDEETAIQAVRLGAQDYLVKGSFNQYQLTRCLRYAIERKKTEERLVVKSHALEQLNEELRLSNHNKSDLLSQVSHELRTPLHAIKGFTKMMLNRESIDRSTRRDYLTIIDREGEALNTMVNNLLDISRLDSGNFQIYRQPTRPEGILINAIESSAIFAQEKGISVKLEIPSPLPEMHLDSEKIDQVVINLLSNAIKYGSSGGDITLTAEVIDDELYVKVIDRGIGIPEKSIPRLFQKFSQLDASIQTGGVGLGLYISKQIVEAHDGHIWTEPTPGSGATFGFKLPVKLKKCMRLPAADIVPTVVR